MKRINQLAAFALALVVTGIGLGRFVRVERGGYAVLVGAGDGGQVLGRAAGDGQIL